MFENSLFCCEHVSALTFSWEKAFEILKFKILVNSVISNVSIVSSVELGPKKTLASRLTGMSERVFSTVVFGGCVFIVMVGADSDV